MWSLFPELLGPMILAFVVGSVFSWALIGMLLPRHPDGRRTAVSKGSR